MHSEYDYPIAGPGDDKPDRPDLELPRCLCCGHEIDQVPIIRLFNDDPDAMWSMCDACASKGWGLGNRD